MLSFQGDPSSGATPHAPVRADGCLHWHFEARVAASPDAVAVEAGGERVTYRGLDARANRLARWLRARGVRPGALVGVWSAPSLGALVGALGTLKAGGAYVPLDPLWPAARARQVLGDATVHTVLAWPAEASRVPELADRVVRLDRPGEWEAQPDTALSREEAGVAPRDLCCVLYTSGTTGRPKGVLIEHRSTHHLVEAEHRLFGTGPADRVFHGASPAFDVSTEEVWLALRAGGTLVVADREAPPGGPGLMRSLVEKGVTVYSTVPSVLATMEGPIPSLRLLILGGEPCPPQLVERWARPGLRIVNTYGPTETTVIATWADVEPGRPVTIGRPLPGYTAYVLDERLRPAAAGEFGELHLGGVGLARGYLNDPGLTREKFIPSPFPPVEGEGRLYCTGDRCRWTAGGELEILGRVDAQVKVRGQRIEPGEVEAVLREMEGVREAAVVACEDGRGERRLAAYVVGKPGGAPGLDELRRHLRGRLPESMVPSAYEVVSELPLTTSGKLDRVALAARGLPVEARSGGGEAARGRVEEALARIWGEVLGEAVGAEDNFFDLGGHSLLAVQMFARVEAELGRRLPLTALLHGPTVRELARVVEAEGDLEARDWVVPIQDGGGGAPLFLMPSLTGDLLHWRDLVRRLGPGQACYGLQPRRRDGRLEPFRRFEDMAARFIEGLRAVQPAGPYQLAGLSFGGEVAFEVARQLEGQGEAVGLLAIFDTDIGRLGGERAGLARSLLASLGNLPWWVRYDLLETGPGETLGRAGRKLASLAWRVGRKVGLDWRGEGAADPDDAWHPDMPAADRRTYEGFAAAWESYAPAPYAGRVTLFRARARPLFYRPSGADLGWGAVARGGVDVRVFPGHHESILREPHVGRVAARLREVLAGG